MRATIIYSLVALSCCFAVGCSEELNPTPYTLSKFVCGEKNKTWKIELFEYAENDTVQNKFMETCLLDDRYKFYNNTERVYETTPGSTLCFQDEPSITTSTWTFTNANATLMMVMPIFSDNSIPFFVRELEDKKMVLELFLDEDNVASYRIHFTMTDEE